MKIIKKKNQKNIKNGMKIIKKKQKNIVKNFMKIIKKKNQKKLYVINVDVRAQKTI